MEDNRLKGVLFMLMSGLAFAMMSFAVQGAGDVTPALKVFSRNFVSLFVALTMIRNQHPRVSLFGKMKHQKLLLSRSLIGLAGVYLLFTAISNGLSLTESNILSRLNPAFVTLFACFFLKEKISQVHVPGLILIFIFAILVIKPEFSVAVIPALCATGTALCAGVTYTIIRHLKGKEEPATIVFYFSFVSVVAMIVPVCLDFSVPTSSQIMHLLGIGLAASIGQFGLTYAYKYAKASEVSIYSYSTIIFALIIDLVIGKTVPDFWSIFGGIGIIATAIVLFIQNKKDS